MLDQLVPGQGFGIGCVTCLVGEMTRQNCLRLVKPSASGRDCIGVQQRPWPSRTQDLPLLAARLRVVWPGLGAGTRPVVAQGMKMNMP